MDSFGSTAAILPERVIAAILPETNLHVKSSIVAILRQYCQTMLQQYCRNRLPEALYFGKGKPFCFTILLKAWLGNKKKQLSAVYCKLIFVAKNLIGPLSCDCKNAYVFHSRQQMRRMC